MAEGQFYDPVSWQAVDPNQVSYSNPEPDSGIFQGGYGWINPKTGGWQALQQGTPSDDAYFSKWNGYGNFGNDFGDQLKQIASANKLSAGQLNSNYMNFLQSRGLDPYSESNQSGAGVASGWWGPQTALRGFLYGNDDLTSRYVNPQAEAAQQYDIGERGTRGQNNIKQSEFDWLPGVLGILGAGFGLNAAFGAGGLGGAAAPAWTSGYDLAGGAGFGMADAPIAGAGWTPDEWLGQMSQGGGGGIGGAAGGGVGAAQGGAQSFIPEIANAKDPIEAIDAAMRATGTDSATSAAQALGYNTPEAMIGAINPAWASGLPALSFPGGTGAEAGGGQAAPGTAPANGAPATPSTAAPTPTKDPTLFQMLSKMGNGVTPSDMFSYLRANPMSLASPIGGGGPISNFTNLASSLYGMTQSKKTKQLAEQYAQQADPFASQRAGYAQQLKSLMSDPSSISSTPGYQAGLDAVTRKMAAAGYLGSGNMMKELSDYGTNAFMQQAQLLSQLSGANANPAAAGQLALAGNSAGNNMMSQALAALGYGTRLFGL